jgi:aspartyl-tRNA(Asn)/glutamyl-tRNA(Gln) amidotransferase subunit A
MHGVSAVSRVQEALERAHASQTEINAFTLIDDERALERAAALDATIQRGEYAGPLAGVPVALKDLINQAGHTTTCGSAFYREEPPTSAICVQRLEDAGAVIIGRTGLHEFAFGFSSENPHFGPVRNPWDTGTSPGGSSGGSAASVAAGITPIAIGTDTGGSVRVPAGLCGTFGLKVTHGRIPLDGVFPLVSSVDTVGPLADSIDNIEVSYRVMSDDEAPEPESRKLSFGIPQPWHDEADFQGDVLTQFENAVLAMRDLGHEITEIPMPEVTVPGEIWNAIAAEVTEVHREFRNAGKPYGADVAQRLDDAAVVTAEQTAVARAWQLRLRDQFDRALQQVDFLLTPTTPAMRKEIGVDMIGGHHYRNVISYFSALVNQSLHPAIAMPVLGSGTPPISIQVIGGLNRETDLIAAGRSLEASGLVGFKPASGIA